MENGNVFSSIREVVLEKFKTERYVIISPWPENDVIFHMGT